MRPRPLRIVVATLIEAALVLGLHLLLLRLLAQRGTVATLFAARPHGRVLDLLLAVGFVVSRLSALLLLPGFVVYRAVRLVFALQRSAVPAEHPSQQPPDPSRS